jgi:hypothetical protein
MNNWFGAKFDHTRYTGYALTGAHATLDCIACHANNRFAGTPAQCYACHTADFQKSSNPPHVQLGLPRECGSCHSTTDWSNAKFDHTLYAHWPLQGKHAAVMCAQCHTNNSYVSTPTDCYSCHKADFQSAGSPNHVSSGFPTDCSMCHTATGWAPSSFNHATFFPLTGAHASVQCMQCHTTSNFASTPKDCYSCHKGDFQSTKDPDHVAAAFPTTCETCHNTTTWMNATFDHNKTPFPLTGAHANVACGKCHVNNVYAGLATDCFSCHKADFQGAKDPDHVVSGFPTATCSSCHNTTGWSPSTFVHASVFPLTGAHGKVECKSCHTTTNYAITAKDCYSCHTKDFTGAKDPNHVAAGFPTTCEMCHNTTTWLSASFDHNKTAFPLTGKHTTVACSTCHVNGVFAGTPTDCYSCHTKDWNGTTDPKHAAAGFPTTCATCHTTSSWDGAVFDHNKTRFPLTGKHVGVTCATCHTTSNYAATPTDCYSCHTKDWNGTTDPKHAAAGFPTTCATCHTTSSWAGAVFDHNKTPFPLTGKHVGVPCATCHTTSNYAATPTDCYSCHTKDWNGTMDPKHAAAGFPTTCATCHTTSSWAGAVFDHNKTPFPLTG